MCIDRRPNGLRLLASAESVPFYLLSDRATATPQHKWFAGYYLSVEAYRGLDASEDNLYAGLFQVTLRPGGSVTIVASTEAKPIP